MKQRHSVISAKTKWNEQKKEEKRSEACGGLDIIIKNSLYKFVNVSFFLTLFSLRKVYCSDQNKQVQINSGGLSHNVIFYKPCEKIISKTQYSKFKVPTINIP